MEHRGEWIPAGAPLSEDYWQALLQDGEYGPAAPGVRSDAVWERRDSEEQDPAGIVVEEAVTGESTPEPVDAVDPWQKAQDLMDSGDVLELPVVSCNRGGLLVGWNGLRGFVPASHLLELNPSLTEEERQAELHRFIGSRLALKIIELDPANSRFVLSERMTQIDEGEGQAILEELEPGDVCRGRVTNLCSFGAFVDLGGFEGLVHISELSWGRVGHPSDVLEPGQHVDVHVLNVEPERERVGLSIKRLQPNPWRSVEDRYQVGQIVNGTITHIVDFGAFVRVEDGLEGLIHVSELSDDQARHPRDVLRTGDVVSVQILSVDGGRRRMGLRLQELLNEPGAADLGDPQDASLPVDGPVED
jgi:small subunit ribosomal protein S1